MVRHYKPIGDAKRKKKKKPVRTDEEVENTITTYFAMKEARHRGALTSAAASIIPKATLHSYINGHKTAEDAIQAFRERKKVGHPTQLSAASESRIYSTCVSAWRQNRTLSPEMVMALASMCAKQEGNPFKGFGGVASRDWYNRFSAAKRLSDHSCKQRSKYRTMAEKEFCVRNFFNGVDIVVGEGADAKTFHLEGFLEALNTVCDTETGETYRERRDRQGNSDESNIVDDNDTVGCAPVGAKHVYCEGDVAEDGITILSTFLADGTEIPDFYISMGTYWTENWLKYAEPGSKGFKRADGYFITWEVFMLVLDEMKNMIPGGVSPTKRFLWLLDGHSSRVHPDCVEKARALGQGRLFTYVLSQLQA